MKYTLLIFTLLILNNSFGQKSATEDSKIVYERIQEDVAIKVIGNEVKVSHSVIEKKHFHDQVNSSYASDRVYHGYFTRIKNLKASVAHVNAKGKYKTHKIEDIPEKSEFSGSTFYSDNSYFDIAYPNVAVGSKTELTYDIEVKDPHFMKRFYFSEYYPIENVEYTVTADAGVEIGWKLYGDQKDKVVFTKAEVDGEMVYKWTLKDSPALFSEPNGPGYLHKATHIVVYIKKYKGSSGEVSVLNDVADLFNWYQTFISDIRPTDNVDLKELTATVIGDATTELDKAKRIFHWVQDNIRYIAFEDGWRGFVPFPASEICDKRYGDCKDMSHLMYEMLAIAGVNAQHAWVGTRKLPYLYEDTPCPSVDNHLILSLVIDDSVYIMDATDANTPFAVPTSFILSKQTLFKSALGDYQLYTIPAFTADYCTVVDEIDLTVDGTAAVGKSSKTIETFEYSRFHNLYGSANTEKDDFLRQYLELGQNNFEISNASIEAVIPRAKTAISFDYRIPDYASSFGELSFINLNLTKPFASEILQKDRKYSYEIKYKKKWQSTVSFVMPSASTITNIPEDVTFKCEYGSCVASYKMDGNTLVYSRIITIDVLTVPTSGLETWNDFIKQLVAVYNTTIEFK
ncbi:MAG: DUF3857 domain-containing protein [Crocinitomix sp.]|nr:DUF3857 domain-containing protein [Crocinitomix sp.]